MLLEMEQTCFGNMVISSVLVSRPTMVIPFTTGRVSGTHWPHSMCKLFVQNTCKYFEVLGLKESTWAFAWSEDPGPVPRFDTIRD